MMNKDQRLIWEAYLQEAPVEPGTSWDEPVAFDKGSKERLGKYSKSTLDDESLDNIVTSIKDFISGHENSQFPGDESDFQDKIRDLVIDAVSDNDKLMINATNAKYVSRVIKNELKRLGVVNITKGKIDVEDAHPADIEASVEKGVDSAVKGRPVADVEKPGLMFRQLYTINDEVEVDGDELNKAKNAISQIFGARVTGKEIIVKIREDIVSYDKAKQIADDLLKLGVIVKVEDEEDEEDDSERVIDVGGDEGSEDEDYRRAVSSAYSDLQRDISSGASPSMRPEDW